jgi:hypothetical protein
MCQYWYTYFSFFSIWSEMSKRYVLSSKHLWTSIIFFVNMFLTKRSYTRSVLIVTISKFHNHRTNHFDKRRGAFNTVSILYLSCIRNLSRISFLIVLTYIIFVIRIFFQEIFWLGSSGLWHHVISKWLPKNVHSVITQKTTIYMTVSTIRK